MLIVKVLRASLMAIGAIVLLIVVAGVASFFAARAFGLYSASQTMRVPSPDRTYVASVQVQEQAYDIETLVLIARSDGSGAKTVVAYEYPARLELRLTWDDPYTLKVLVPCIPPNRIFPAYWDDRADETHRVIVEVEPIDRLCRFPRGPRPDAGWPQEQAT